jgi:hypothetical protein
LGDRHAEQNAYQWEHIIENLPFSRDYVASLPKLRKVQKDGASASEVVQYVDD